MAFNQRIGPEIAPADPTWPAADAATRLQFYRQAGTQAVAIKRAELARGIGKNGRRMAPRQRPRPDGAAGPVLTPHGPDSRTARLMASHATTSFLTLFWRSGHSNAQRLPWGTILGFHARGEVPGAPVRDVRLSQRGISQLKADMARWWTAHHAERLRREQAERIAAAAAEAKRAKTKVKSVAKRVKAAVVAKFPKLAPYLKPRGGGF